MYLVLHYQHLEELCGWVILNPEWATKAFYRIVRNKDINESKGRFHKNQLQKIWWQEDSDKKNYPLSIFDTLIALMKEFDLCFQLQDKREYIVPQLLNEEENETAKEKVDGEDTLRFIYSYTDVIPAGMVSRFICKQHNNIAKDEKGHFLYWRYGVLIEREDTFALVEQPIGDKKIKITLKGKNKRELLARIRGSFEELHVPLNNLKPDEILPCICSQCKQSDNPHPFKFNIIKRRLAEKEVFERCDISDEKVDRRKLYNDAIDESFIDVAKIKALIAKGDFKNVMALMGNDTLGTMIKSRFSQLSQKELMGLIDLDDDTLNKNKILYDVLRYFEGKQEDTFL